MCEWDERMDAKNPVMNIPIKKIINTELFIDKMAALYIWETRTRAETKGVQLVGTSWLEEGAYLAQNRFLDIIRCGYERLGVKLSWNDETGTW